jgi:hypothetical protein
MKMNHCKLSPAKECRPTQRSTLGPDRAGGFKIDFSKMASRDPIGIDMDKVRKIKEETEAFQGWLCDVHGIKRY